MKKLSNTDNALLAIPVLLLIAGLSFSHGDGEGAILLRTLSIAFFTALIVFNIIKIKKSQMLILLILVLYLFGYLGLLFQILHLPIVPILKSLGTFVHIPLALFFFYQYLKGSSGKGDMFYLALGVIYLLYISDLLLGILPISSQLLVYPLIACLITIQANKAFDNVGQQRLLLMLTADAFLGVIALLFKLI